MGHFVHGPDLERLQSSISGSIPVERLAHIFSKVQSKDRAFKIFVFRLASIFIAFVVGLKIAHVFAPSLVDIQIGYLLRFGFVEWSAGEEFDLRTIDQLAFENAVSLVSGWVRTCSTFDPVEPF